MYYFCNCNSVIVQVVESISIHMHMQRATMSANLLKAFALCLLVHAVKSRGILQIYNYMHASVYSSCVHACAAYIAIYSGTPLNGHP